MKRLLTFLGVVYRNERGALAVNTDGIFLIIMAIMTAVIAFNVFPNVLTGADSVRTNTAVGNYTGLSTVVQIGPTILFLAMTFSSLVSGFFGVKRTIGK